jgi:hypothetical protein
MVSHIREETYLEGLRYEVFTGMMIQVMVSWGAMLCSDEVGYQCSGRPCCLCFQTEDGGSMVPHNLNRLSVFVNRV